MRILSLILALAGALASARATTVQKMSTADMIAQSTQIVHVKVSGTRTAFRGQAIYTYYQLQILESWKAPAGASQPIEVAVPGGVAGGLRQSVAGAPPLNVGGEYVIFLWTSRAGLTQVIGLSQGLFSVVVDASGNAMLIRPALTELMLDSSGHVVSDTGTTMSLADLRLQLQQAFGAGK
jgi:hypothetical protein